MAASIEMVIHEKKEEFMGTSYERTFTVSVPVERAWRAMTDPEELSKWYFPFEVSEDGSTRTEILGRERPSEVVEFEPQRMFRTRSTITGEEAWGLTAGTREMTVVFEAVDMGTRITITNSGFGEGADWERDLENAMRGQAETISDLICTWKRASRFRGITAGRRAGSASTGARYRQGSRLDRSSRARSLSGWVSGRAISWWNSAGRRYSVSVRCSSLRRNTRLGKRRRQRGCVTGR
jgi:uncharacterized protein YndB with AHSA1/START domain